MSSESSEEDCNLEDEEEERTQNNTTTQKKALLSIDKILTSIKSPDCLKTSDGAMATLGFDEEGQDQFGTLIKYKDTLPSIISKKLDGVLLRNLVLRCRGVL